MTKGRDGRERFIKANVLWGNMENLEFSIPFVEVNGSPKTPFTLLELIFEWNILQLHGGYGVYNKVLATVERFKVKADRIAVDEVNRIMKLEDEAEREARLWSLRRDLDSFLDFLQEKVKDIR